MALAAWHAKKRSAAGQGRRGGPNNGRWMLNRPLLDWTGQSDLWSIGDACEGTLALGSPGAGKTNGSGRYVANRFLSHGFGGLALTSKVSDRPDWQHWARETRRSGDLIVFGPDTPHRFNFLEYLIRTGRGERGGSTESIVHALRDLAGVVAGDGRRQEVGERIWDQARDDLLRNAIDLLRLAGEEVSVKRISDLVFTSPRTPQDVKALLELVHAVRAGRPPELELTYFEHCWLAAARAYERGSAIIDRHSLAETISFWREVYPRMAFKTRSSVEFTLRAALSPFLRGDLAELLCTRTTITPEITLKGKILVLDLPVKDYLEAGAVAQAIFKYVWQKAVERRSVPPGASVRPVFLWVDEAHEFITPHDLRFQATARTARACSVYITQNIASLRNRLGADETENLTGLLQTKIFHANDTETNVWAADGIGRDWGYVRSFNGDGNVSHSEQLRHIIDPIEFSKLARGNADHGYQTHAIVSKGGAGWRNGRQNFVSVKFSTRKKGRK